VATGGEDRRVKVWDIAAGRVLRELKGHTAAVTGLAWGADSRLLLSSGREGAVRAWDAGAEEGQAIATLQAGGQVAALDWTDTNTLLVTALESPAAL
jgi:WD40 repeat protein